MARGNSTIKKQGTVLPDSHVEQAGGPGPPHGSSKGSRPNNEWKKDADSPSAERFYGEGLNPDAGDGRDGRVDGTLPASGNVPETRISGKQDPAQKAR